MNQLVFIDDSGDPGFSSKSTGQFVIACIIFDDHLEAESASLAIKKLKRTLKFPDSVEFKFFHSRPDVKKQFLEAILPFSFRVRAIVMQKGYIYSEELKNSKDSFYNYAIKSVLTHSKSSIKNAKIFIDGHGDRVFTKNLKAYLRRSLNNKDTQIMQDLKLVDSRSSTLIQMADMIAGSIRRSYNPELKNHDQYRKIFKSKIEDIWEFK